MRLRPKPRALRQIPAPALCLAGKSTLFNALTQAGTAATGVVPAKTAAAPFTTIAPNVGPAWWAAPAEEEPEALVRGSTPTAHGRAADGRRLLPCTVIDVAGLVPGAYQGRGRGNQFLADLCTADVLIHVVDASGQTDEGGNLNDRAFAAAEEVTQAAEEAADAAVAREVVWVAEEVHNWVFENVRRKRPAWRRRPLRLGGMFSGYGCSPALVAGALARARTAMDVAAAPRPPELGGPPLPCDDAASLARACGADTHDGDSALHRLVAYFVAARWPTVVALNKCDVTSRHARAAQAHHGATRKMVCHLLLSPTTSSHFPPPSTTLPTTFHSISHHLPQMCVAARSEVELLEARAAGSCVYVEGGANATATATATGTATCISSGESGSEDGTAAAAVGALARAQAVLGSLGTTGTLDAISTAVMLRPPTLAFPVASLATLEPLRSAPQEAAAPSGGDGGVGGGSDGATPLVATPLLDCLMLKPCSTVGDLVEVCKRASPPLLSGDFVRADARAARPTDEQLAKGLPVRKDSVVTAAIAIVRLQTNRRSQWQK